MAIGRREEGLNRFLQVASTKPPILDLAYEPLSVGVGGRRRLFVIRIDSRGEDMQATILRLPIFARAVSDTEFFAYKLF